MAIHSILIIEDDRFIGEMYVRSLQKANYDVDWMVDGNDGHNIACKIDGFGAMNLKSEFVKKA